ncbi:MAG TPA: hypothetical protein PLN52_17115 [Opitutaceae bacterium]|nr:hypothetical protein [Opitutaceae bacterium]
MRKNSFSRLLSTALALFFLSSSYQAQGAWAGVTGSVSPSVSRVENISRTVDPGTRKDATLYTVAFSAGQTRQIARSWFLGLSLEGDLLFEPKFSRNDRHALGPLLSLQKKFGLGPFAPVLSLETSYHYQGHELRSARGEISNTSLRFSKRLSEPLKVGAHVGIQDRQARGAVFDHSQRYARVEATFDFLDQWSVRGAASIIDGPQTANANPQRWADALSGVKGDNVARYYQTLPNEVTELYGPGWLSYSPEAKSWEGTLSLRYQSVDRWSLEAQASATRTKDEAVQRYPSQSLSLSFIYPF